MIEMNYRIHNRYNRAGWDGGYPFPKWRENGVRVYCRCCQTDIVFDKVLRGEMAVRPYGYKIESSRCGFIKNVIDSLGFIENGIIIKCGTCSSKLGLYNSLLHHVVVTWGDKLGIIGIQ